jgi:hypothetical protein
LVVHLGPPRSVCELRREQRFARRCATGARPTPKLQSRKLLNFREKIR